jgi:hypothetical protein
VKLPDNSHSSPIQMPAAAERSLRRATRQTLTSFASLRKALREHVESQRREHALVEIEIQLRALVAHVRRELPIAPADAGSQDNLSEHVMEWTETFFRAPRDHT